MQQRDERQVERRAERMGACVVHEDRGQQGDAEPGGGDRDVVPGRLRGTVGVVQGHQQGQTTVVDRDPLATTFLYAICAVCSIG